MVSIFYFTVNYEITSLKASYASNPLSRVRVCVSVTVFFLFGYGLPISHRQCTSPFLPFHKMTIGHVEVWGVENDNHVSSLWSHRTSWPAVL